VLIKEESMYGFFVCWDEKVAFVERWPLVEVRLYNIANCGRHGFFIIIHFCFFGALSPSGIGEAFPVKENQPQKFVPAT